MTPDRIDIAGLHITATHGVLDFEKRIPQPFLVDVTLEADLLPAAERDDLTASLSYADVAARVIEVATAQTFDLIEALAQAIASACLEWTFVEAVTVRVRKPHAPAGVAFENGGGPSVTIRREQCRNVVIAMGTNLGRRIATLRSAVDALRALPGVRVTHVSPLVETEPLGGVSQPDYLNAVVVGTTRLTGEHLLRELHRIEAEHGRVREIRWGARTLDLDLIQLGLPGESSEVRTDTPGAAARDAMTSPLALPHPRAHERGFVMVPWAQATPWGKVRTPEGILDVVDLARELADQGVRPGPSWADEEFITLGDPL